MATLVKYPVENSEETILVEIEYLQQRGALVQASRTEDRAKDATETLNVTLCKADTLLNTVVSSLGDINPSDAQMTVEFGLKLTEDCQVIVASASEEANFKIKLKFPETA